MCEPKRATSLADVFKALAALAVMAMAAAVCWFVLTYLVALLAIAVLSIAGTGVFIRYLMTHHMVLYRRGYVPARAHALTRENVVGQSQLPARHVAIEPARAAIEGPVMTREEFARLWGAQ